MGGGGGWSTILGENMDREKEKSQKWDCSGGRRRDEGRRI